jgi:hypothetical protein
MTTEEPAANAQVGYRDYPITIRLQTAQHAAYALTQLLGHYEDRVSEEQQDYYQFLTGITHEAIDAINEAVDREQAGIRAAHEREVVEVWRLELARRMAEPLPPIGELSPAARWMIARVLHGSGAGQRANQADIEAAGPVRDLADQLVGLGLLTQGEQVPESPLHMVHFHVTEAGATAIDKPFVEPGSEIPGAKPLIRRRRERKV